MSLQHLDCTTEERRIQLCNEFEIHADDCIVLYGNKTIKSDANNRTIYDKYYQFSCRNRANNDIYVIVCGSGAARHLCKLIGEPMPHSMNPFIQEENGGQGGVNGHNEPAWNTLRLHFYYCVQIFITRYQEILTPGTKIFNILHGITDESFLHYPPQKFQFEQFGSVVNAFHTSVPSIIGELEKYGRVRHFNLEELAIQYEDYFPTERNIFHA